MTTIRASLLIAAAWLAGCANFSADQCRGANWYNIGVQDAYLYGLRPQITAIAHECQKFGVQVPEGDYMEGWRAGDRERAVRTQRSM